LEINMTHKLRDIGVAGQIGSYSDAVEVEPHCRWLFTSGTPGIALDSELPADVSGQAEKAWLHVLTMLEGSGMAVGDIVKVSQYVTRAEDIAPYAKVRKRFLGEWKPASMLLVIPQLVRPDLLVEIEITAAKR
jgi:enamine deaminase RidA (YjgF/YER057c/UK114 family)